MLRVRSNQAAPTPAGRVARLARRGFTLVEILIVVIILGVLAAIVVPQFSNAAVDAEQKAFITALKRYASAAQVYHIKNGVYLEDASSGEVPAGLEAYIDSKGWRAGTPLGGVWDTELNGTTDSGEAYISALGVHFQGVTPPPDSDMAAIDAVFDDGDINTGAFQKLTTDRFYYILAR